MCVAGGISYRVFNLSIQLDVSKIYCFTTTFHLMAVQVIFEISGCAYFTALVEVLLLPYFGIGRISKRSSSHSSYILVKDLE